MKIITQINEKFENGFTKGLFDHIRNLLISAFLLAIGTGQLQGSEEMFFSVFDGKYSGVGVITIACILVAINIYDGIRIICKARMSLFFSIPTIAVYLFFILKILEMAWDFRVPY